MEIKRMTIFNYNMMNSNFLTGFYPQGFGMGSSNYFTNCFGEINYDALAGYSVFNALAGVANQAIGTYTSEKQEKKQNLKDSQNRLEEINEEISELKNCNPEEEIDKKFDSNIDTAQKNLNDANNALIEAKNSKITLESQLAKATTDEEKGKIQAQIDDLKIDEKQKAFDKLNGDENTEGSVKYYEKQKANAIEAKKNEINEKLEKLKAEKSELQELLNNQKLDDADGSKWQRTKPEEFNSKWEKKENAAFTKGDMRYAIAGYRNATTETDKKDWANKIATIYTYFMNNDIEKITPDFKAARQIVDSYVK